jgi:high frequency lysogenization protein
MPQTDHDRVIALAGVVQAADLVRAVAQRGQVGAEDMETCLLSLIKIDAADSADIYGGVVRLRAGFRLLEQQLNHPQDMELTRYVVALLGLERKLARRFDLLRIIRAGLDEVIQNLNYFPVDHSNAVARFANLYLQSLSTLSPRIIVSGDPAHLNNPENANRIRALLLAGVRAATLWRQSGGGRLTLLLRRNPLLRETRRLLTEVD